MLLKSDFGAGQIGERNVQNAVEQAHIFDTDWFYETDNDEKYSYYEMFIEEFANWLRANGEDIDEYRNKPIDIEYYFQQYMEDYDADHTGIEGCYQAVADWLEGEEEFAASLDNAHSLYAYESGATDVEFYTKEVQYEAERAFKEQRYTQEDLTHGFKNAKDLEEAVWRAIDKGALTDVDEYDAGSYGTIRRNPDYFITGYTFLGNGETEYQLQTDVPFDEKHDYSSEVSVYMPGYPKGDLLYVTTTWMFTYGVPWEAVEVAGDELGLRDNSSSNGEEF